MKAFIGKAIAAFRQALVRKVNISLDNISWGAIGAKDCNLEKDNFTFLSDDSEWGYQVISEPLNVDKGTYVQIRLEGTVESGALALGLLCEARESWINNHVIEEGPLSETFLFDVNGHKKITVVFSNAQKGQSKICLSKLEVKNVCDVNADKVEGIEQQILKELEALTKSAEPAVFDLTEIPSKYNKIKGSGVYLRTDYWAPMKAGGSYGHTCYVAKELHQVSEKLVCYMANSFEMLDDFGIEQIEMPKPFETCNEIDVLKAPLKYYPYLREKFSAEKPAYIYERYIIGNYAGAKLAQEMHIPYILEYNGSEISLRNSFDDSGYEYEEAFVASERFLFSQAALIVCVSQVIADSLIDLGVPEGKILINPNGCSPEHYKPLSKKDFLRKREQFGWGKDECVIGFIGTFGGWHGIDILADSLNKIYARNENIRFLLIGDGNYKQLVLDAVCKYKLHDKVVMTGTVPQNQAAELLAACDICVSPHNKNMVDSKFFGSPTKLFEYMSLATAIVASDLEQIGEVLKPSLVCSDFPNPDLSDKPRAVLCTPGDLDEFVEAVILLSKEPNIRDVLGENARNALINNYSWHKHVEHILNAIVKLNKSA